MRLRSVVWRERVRQVAWAALFVLLTIGGSVLAVGTMGRSVYRWHGIAVELRLLPASRGRTSLVLIPLGEVQAHTHRAPVALIATLQEIQLDEINKVLNSSPKLDALTQDFEQTARKDLHNFVIRQLVFAALGALLAPLLLHSRKAWKYGLASFVGVAVVGAALWSALATFNGKAFESPTYTGALRQAPWVIQFGKDAFARIEELSQKLRTVAANLNVLYGRIAEPPDRLAAIPDSESVRILHVSDLHNDPAAIPFMQEVARQFRVSLIVDTGDLTDFGSPPETAMVQGISRLGYPYVFVAGNHDSQTVVRALERLPNVTVLNGQLASVHGFTFIGLPNPASARAGVGSVDTTPDEIRTGGDELLRAVQAQREPPDIVAIHNPEEARPLFGKTPVVLCGHLHRYYVEVEKQAEEALPSGIPDSSRPNVGRTEIRPAFETVVCNAGTTGAAGLRYFQREEGVPFSCAVLTFRRAHAKPAVQPTGVRPSDPPNPANPPPPAPRPVSTRPQLASIDLIVLDGELNQYSIIHRPFLDSAAIPAPSR